MGEGEVEADDLVVAVDEDRMDPKARTAAPIQVTIHLPNGTSYPLKSETKSARNVIEKANKAGPSVRLAIFP